MKLPRHAETWLPGYIRSRMSRFSTDALRQSATPRRVFVTITDHYEPFWKNTDPELARRRVEEWRAKWPVIADRNRDSQGRPAQYCFFYPEEEYRPELLDLLAEITHGGTGDVDVHLHHDHQPEQEFIDRTGRFIENLHHRHGLLRKENGRIVFGFIHGDWALDNSHPAGSNCGLNNELTLLLQLGCYADFTMPCGPLPMQARMINEIYWATDDPQRPKSYDMGVPVHSSREERPGALLMITGPFGLRWQDRIMPRIEIGELAGHNKVNRQRVRLWLTVSPRVNGDIFVKLFSHGTQEDNARELLDGGLDRMFTFLREECAQRHYELHYVTAWQMRQVILGRSIA